MICIPSAIQTISDARIINFSVGAGFLHLGVNIGEYLLVYLNCCTFLVTLSLDVPGHASNANKRPVCSLLWRRRNHS